MSSTTPPPAATLPSFFERLEARARAADSLLCVGLDPHPEDLPSFTATAARDFCLRIIDATAPYAAAFKPNVAFFEALGAEGHAALAEVNQLSEVVNQRVDDEVSSVLAAGKIPAVLGGDHSVPLGAWRALARRVPSFGVLHIDAHLDLRDAYEGFQYSHASILRNGLNEVPAITRLVQVGMRDVGEDEVRFAGSQGERVRVFFDRELSRRRFVGEPWVRVARLIVDALPEQVWVTFDIDGLDPKLCPNTGTPVPGGLELAEANFLLGEVVRSGRKILGFDLNEVSPAADGRDEWDANVGARVLYRMLGLALRSRGFGAPLDLSP